MDANNDFAQLTFGIEIAEGGGLASRVIWTRFNVLTEKHGLELVQEAIHACTKEGSAMLVLSRKLGEKICIGDNIFITVVDIDRGKIRLGIDAPRDIPIYRQELLPLSGVAARPEETTALTQ
jgi:carbon storage regulator